MISRTGIIASSGGGSISELSEFVARVVAVGGTVTGGLLTAYNNLFIDLSATSLRSKVGRLNLFASDGFSGIFVPAIISFDGINTRGNASDINNNFVSGNYVLTSGLGDAANTTKYLSTNYQADNLPETSAVDFSIGVITNNVGVLNEVDMGGRASYPLGYFLCVNNPFVSMGGSMNDNDLGSITAGAGLGALSRINISTRISYNPLHNTTLAVNGTNNVSGHATYVFALNDNSTAIAHSTRILQGYYAGKGLTLVELQLLNTILTTFNTAIGR